MDKKKHNSMEIKEAWSGPGRKDGVITEFKPEYDALHIDMKKRGGAEWWYFDARLDNGYIAVGFFRAKHERTGKTGVEITFYKPNGEKIQNLYNYSRSDFTASYERPDVRIGNNYIKSDFTNGKFPTYEVFMDEGEFGFHLKFTAKVHSWIPGSGFTQFGKKGHFGWCVGLPKADVEGTITVNGETLQIKGIGYHDHNWLNFNFQLYLDYWYWGRLYSENFTFLYAYIMCNKKVDNYPIKVLMLAKDEKVILSTGEYEMIQENHIYHEKVDNSYPKTLIFDISKQQKITLEVEEVIDGDNLLFEFGPVLRFIVKNVVKLNPGYFRLKSKYSLDVVHEGKSYKEQGDTLHEMVITR